MTILLNLTVILLSLGLTAGTDCVCGFFGGNGGGYFSDFNKAQSHGPITAFEIWHDNFIQGLRFVYGGISGNHHGGYSGRRNYIALDEGEFIEQVTGKSGTLVDQLKFHTNTVGGGPRRILGPYGGTGGATTFQTSGGRLSYITGHSGSGIDKVAFYYVD